MPPATATTFELNVMTISLGPVAGALIYHISERIRAGTPLSIAVARKVILWPAYVMVATVGSGSMVEKMLTPTTRILFVPAAPTV